MHGQWTTHSTPSYKYLMLNQFCCRECIRPHQNNPKLLPIVNMKQKDPRQQCSRGQHGAHMGLTGPRWAPWTLLSGDSIFPICYMYQQLFIQVSHENHIYDWSFHLSKGNPVIHSGIMPANFIICQRLRTCCIFHNADEISKFQLLNDTIILAMTKFAYSFFSKHNLICLTQLWSSTNQDIYSWYTKDKNIYKIQTVSKYRAVTSSIPDSKVHGPNMGPIWGRQDPGGPHVGPMNFAIWEFSPNYWESFLH